MSVVKPEVDEMQSDSLYKGKGRIGVRIKFDKLSSFLPFVLAVIVLIFLWFYAPNFFNPRNFVNILTQTTTLALMAMGLTFVLITGGMDLSIPSVMAVSAIVGADLIKHGMPPLLGAFSMVGMATLLGAVNGLSVAQFKMIPFIVTLAMMQIATGASTWITNSVSIALPAKFYNSVLIRIGIFPIPIFVVILLVIFITLVTSKSIYGRWLYSLGVNEKASQIANIPTKWVKFSAYVASGFMAGLTSILLSARLGSSGAPMGDSNVVLDVMSAAVIGGVSIYGGVGSPVGAALGALFIVILNNSLNLLRVEFFPALIIKGCLIIAFVAFDSIRKR
ncbi:MAG: ABC transporter permease [Anaerolineaceae bacterium]|nr:ABC transporter permease [Anaerolineaceae bacterium]